MHMIARCSIAVLMGALVSAWTPHAVAAGVLVFAASSLKEAMDDQAKQFGAATGHKVTVSYAASSALARQIESGAPADLFISADPDWMDYVARKGRIVPDTRADLLRNTLVLIAPARSTSSLTIGVGFALAGALGSGKLAMADPDFVPAGKYGKRALERLGVWARVEKQVARADSVRAALALVARGEAPYGIVYATDALSEKDVRIVDTFPASTHPPIVYPIAVLAGSRSAAAKPLLDYLRSAPARGTWERYGFRVAQ